MWLGCVFFIIVGICILACIINDYYSSRDRRAVELEKYRFDREKSVDIIKLKTENQTLKEIIEKINIK